MCYIEEKNGVKPVMFYINDNKALISEHLHYEETS